jgi:hypothetical protein
MYHIDLGPKYSNIHVDISVPEKMSLEVCSPKAPVDRRTAENDGHNIRHITQEGMLGGGELIHQVAEYSGSVEE